jgi:SAM-dependent methyltransferase
MAHTNLERCRQEWEDLAQRDPLWAILSYRRHKFGRWDRDAFLATGTHQVEALLARSRTLGHPQRWERVLDFGCGIGRLAPALSAAFDSYVGMDISETMIAQATQLHASRPNCSFFVETDEHLERWPEGSFDLVYSLHVLQHLDSPTTILVYLASLLRLLRRGGLWVVQLPGLIPAAERLAYDTRRALYARLAGIGVPRALLYRRLGLFPMTMNFVPEDQVLALVRGSGARVLDVERTRVGVAIGDRAYYVTR